MAIDLEQIKKTLQEIVQKGKQVAATAETIASEETAAPVQPAFDVDTPTGEVDISQLDNIQNLRNQVRGLETRFASEKEAQEELVGAIEPSPRALELQKELLAERQTGRAGQIAIRGQPIPQPLIGRQAEVLREQVELRELPLIEELKLEAQKQQTVFEKAKARLGFETAGIERVLDLEKEFRQMDRTQRQDARGLLEGIIGSLEGLAFEDLSLEQQAQLEGLVAGTGISLEVIKAGMANAKRIADEKAIKKPDLLSVAEAKALGVPFGTTRDEAAQLGLVPGAPPTLEEVTTETTDLFKQYQDAKFTRKEIEDQWMADNKTTTISPLVEEILDDLFGKPKDIGEKVGEFGEKVGEAIKGAIDWFQFWK